MRYCAESTIKDEDLKRHMTIFDVTFKFLKTLVGGKTGNSKEIHTRGIIHYLNRIYGCD